MKETFLKLYGEFEGVNSIQSMKDINFWRHYFWSKCMGCDSGIKYLQGELYK